jgi:hypothetical protein
MFKRAALFIALALPLAAAPWDGVRGSFTVVTLTSPTSIPGVPSIPTAVAAYTVMNIQCSDSSVTAVRVRLTYRDDNGERQISLLADLVDGRGGIVTGIPQDQITAAALTELRDGASF